MIIAGCKCDVPVGYYAESFYDLIIEFKHDFKCFVLRIAGLRHGFLFGHVSNAVNK